MEHNVANAVLAPHIIRAFLALGLGQTGFPKSLCGFYGVFFLLYGPGLFYIRRIFEFVRASAGFACNLNNRAAVYSCNNMIKGQLALSTVGLDIIPC